MRFPVRPEVQCLVALARGDPDLFRRSLAAGVEVAPLLDLAHRHEVAPLCYWMWRHATFDAIPRGDHPVVDAIRKDLRLACLYHTMRNEELLRTVVSLDQLFREEGVGAVYFKGLWMAWRAYPDPGARPIGDIDVGIREEQYHSAVRALSRLDYSPRDSLPASPGEAVRLAHYRSQIRFVAARRRPVELHFRLINMGPADADESWAWKNLETLRAGSRSLHVPGIEAMAFHVLLHANQHGFAVLRLLHDVRWLLEAAGDTMPWDALVERTGAYRCAAAIYHALELSRDLAGAPVPEDVLARLRPGHLRRRVFETAWRLGSVRRLEAPRVPRRVEAPLLYLLEMGSLRDKIAYLRGIASGSGAFRRLPGRTGQTATG